MINTNNGLFRNCMAKVLDQIEADYYNDITNVFETDRNIQTLEDWLEVNPKVLGIYIMSFIIQESDFDFDEYHERDSKTYR